MARAATETQAAGLTGLEFGLAIPGTVGGAVWANAGAHGAEMAGGPRVGDAAARRRDRGRRCPRRTSASPTATAGSRTANPPGSASPAEIVLAATFRLAPADPDRDQGAPRRDPEVAPRAPAAGDPVGGLRVPEPGRRLGRPAGRRAGPQGIPCRAAPPCPRSTPTSSSTTQKGTAADVRRVAEHVRARGPRRVAASSWRSRSSSPATGPAADDPEESRLMPRADRPRSRRDAGRGRAGRAVGGARRVDRVRVGDRRRPGRVRATRSRPG